MTEIRSVSENNKPEKTRYFREQQILKLLENEQREFFTQEIIKITGISRWWLSKIAKKMAQQGLIKRIEHGKRVAYCIASLEIKQPTYFNQTDYISGMIPELVDFLHTMKVEWNRSDKTIRLYKYRIVNFYRFLHGYDKPAFAARHIATITREDVRRFLNFLYEEQKASDYYRALNIAILKSYFAFCLKAKYIIENPLEDFKTLQPEKKHKKSFTMEEFNKMLDISKTIREKTLLLLLLGTGGRVSEIEALNIDDINFSTDTVYLTIFKHRSKVKESTPISPNVTKTLEDYIYNHREKPRNPTNKALFLNNSGNRLSKRGIQKIVARICSDAGIPRYSPHSFRRACGKLMLQNGANLRVVQEQLHHDNIQTTITYTEVVSEHHKREYADTHPLARED